MQLRGREDGEAQQRLHRRFPARRLRAARVPRVGDSHEAGAQRRVVGFEAGVPLQRRRERDEQVVRLGSNCARVQGVAPVVAHGEQCAAREGGIVRRARVHDDQVGVDGVVEGKRVRGAHLLGPSCVFLGLGFELR